MSYLTGRFAICLAVCAAGLSAADWTPAVEVRHDTTLCVSYQARLAGDTLLVRAKIEPGWHTFAMDNKQRADEKLAGKKPLGLDQPTTITLSQGLEAAGGWRQSPVQDFSKPELRWFAWGFEREALFAVKVRKTGAGPAQAAIRGQACTESICKNIDVTIPVALGGAAGAAPGAAELKDLIPIRQ
jgi:hypothetical protein